MKPDFDSMPTILFLVIAYVVGFLLLLRNKYTWLTVSLFVVAGYILSGCGEPADLYTSAGIPVHIDKGSAAQVNDVRLYDYTIEMVTTRFQDVSDRAATLMVDDMVDDGFHIYMENEDLHIGTKDILGYYDLDNVHVESRTCAAFLSLGHELLHVLQWLELGEIDDNHLDPRLWGYTDDSIEANIRPWIHSAACIEGFLK